MSLHTKRMHIALVFFLKNLIGGKLFYHFVLVSAIQPCKLAIIIYIYITCFLSLSPLLE